MEKEISSLKTQKSRAFSERDEKTIIISKLLEVIKSTDLERMTISNILGRFEHEFSWDTLDFTSSWEDPKKILENKNFKKKLEQSIDRKIKNKSIKAIDIQDLNESSSDLTLLEKINNLDSKIFSILEIKKLEETLKNSNPNLISWIWDFFNQKCENLFSKYQAIQTEKG